MGSIQAASEDSLFNNALFSDVLIRQTHNQKTKEYHAHKAVMCTGSKWFRRALTGNFMEAKSNIIQLNDDDPIYFELLLRFLYNHEWNEKVSLQKSLGSYSGTFPSKALTPIGVYALADKYDVSGLKTCAVEQVPLPTSTQNPYSSGGPIGVAQVGQVLEAH